MPGPWIADAVVLTAIGQRLSKDPAALETYYTTLANKANRDAAADITGIMLGLGYTIAQLDSWDYATIYNERLAVYFAFNTPPLNEAGVIAEKALDCRDTLRTLTAIIISGVAIAPTAGASAVGGVASGTLTALDDTMYGDPRYTGVTDRRSRSEDWFR